MDSIVSALASGHFKISIAIFVFTAALGWIFLNMTGKEKATKFIGKLERHREFDKERMKEELLYQKTGNKLLDDVVFPYAEKNKSFFSKYVKMFGIDTQTLDQMLIRANITNISGAQIALINIAGIFAGLFIAITGLLLFGTVGLLVGLLLAAITNILPKILIQEKYNARKLEMLHVLPITLKLLADATSTGHTIDSAIMKVRRKYDNILCKEFEKVEEEAKFTNDWILSLEHMAARCDITEIDNLVSEIKISKERGIPITEILIIFADKIEKESQLKLSEVARKKSTTLLLPILLFLFGPLVLLILLPAMDNIMKAM